VYEEASSVGEKEWYFFCIRGRKYRNSIRPNRVTGSGFWKATGIDKPIYCVKEPHECIGLKKSLVYYRGSAGKGTKTDWMMHEFRLPPNGKSTTNTQPNDIQEAVSQLCYVTLTNILLSSSHHNHNLFIVLETFNSHFFFLHCMYLDILVIVGKKRMKFN